MTREMVKQIECDYWAKKEYPIDMAKIFDLAQKAVEQEPSYSGIPNKSEIPTGSTTKNDLVLIHTEGLDEEIRCTMCTNYMKSDRGCDGSCVVDKDMYKAVMDAIEKRIQPTTRNCFGCKYSKDNHNAGTEECHLCMWENQYTPTTKNNLGVDAISRKQAIEEADKLCLETGYDNEKVIEMLNELPSVTPIRPKGHWIPVRVDRYSEQYGHFKINEYKCSNCNSEFEYGYHNYCPYCGAKMVEPQESEVEK